VAGEVLAAGEGIETVLSPRMVLPHMPMMAALSAAHLAAILFPLKAALCLLVIVKLALDPAGGTVKEVDSPPKQIVEVGFEAGVAERSEKGVEDVCDCGG
ncbi:toprim domain-containing protein, partial [Brucella anthropi]|uniref:toprim domain-containing protein n=1 Tax=Brucella anthropi TaxID=529 RepID=UPI001F47761E